MAFIVAYLDVFTCLRLSAELCCVGCFLPACGDSLRRNPNFLRFGVGCSVQSTTIVGGSREMHPETSVVK